MKKYKFSTIAIVAMLFVWSCKQEVIDLQPIVDTTHAVTPNKGLLSFNKFVAVGTSYTAGFQAGALFTDGQNNSLAAILNKQFETVGAPADFKQPTIGSTNGYNIFITPNPIGSVYLGRFLLQYNGASSPLPTPQLSDAAAFPNIAANPSFQYTGTTSELNNFSVQAFYLVQALTPAAGGPPPPAPNAAYSPFYARFASSPSPDGSSGSKLITDAAGAGATFFFFWLGMDDFLLHAAYGGDANKAPLTSTGAFDAQFPLAIGAMMSIPDIEGAIANFPDIFVMPHFTSVPYNPIPLDQGTADLVNSNYAGYNAILDALKGPPFNYAAADVDARKIHFDAGNNPFVLIDETVKDYGDEFDGLLANDVITQSQRDALVPYEQVRQSTAADIIPLSAGSVLGTLADPNNPLSIYGVAVPMADRYVLIPDEINAINDARSHFNLTIANYVTANSSNLVLADMETEVHALVSKQVMVQNGVTITPNINPPTGIYSEDGIHPNSRGYAFLSNVIISAINNKTAWGATIPKTDLSKYGATALPIP